MMREYNQHEWAKYAVREPAQAPAGAHYAAVLFGTRAEWSPGYDKNDPDTSHSVPEITYFAFVEKERFEDWVAAVTRSGRKFFCFHVARLAVPQVRIVVDLGV